MRRLGAAVGVVLGVAFAFACNSATLTEAAPSTKNPTENGSSTGEGDEEEGAPSGSSTSKRDAGTSKADAKASVDSGTTPEEPEPPGLPPEPVAPDGGGSCPAPATFGPTQNLRGFLPAQTVTVASIADGDSGDFNFPGNPRQSVRMMYINTEESGGDDPSLITEFGKETKTVVRGYFAAARTVQISLHEKPNAPGQPDADIYGRWLGLVFLDGELLQRRLVREGWTPYYSKFGCAPAPLHNVLLYAEAEANDADRGIWAPGPHYDYREGFNDWNRSCRPNPFKAPYCPAQ